LLEPEPKPVTCANVCELVQCNLPLGQVEPQAALRFVRSARARRYVLRVADDGGVRVTIPRGGSRREAEAFAQRQHDWIARQRARLVAAAAAAPAIDPAGLHAMRVHAGEQLPRRLKDLALAHGLTVERVSIRDQRTRWGSCGRNGHITLNWRLVLMPDAVRDYVLIHELMHLRRMDHSPAFWRCVAAACPDYATASAWLRLNGPSLR
jgi:predicted metal-dependent hydrolase